MYAYSIHIKTVHHILRHVFVKTPPTVKFTHRCYFAARENNVSFTYKSVKSELVISGQNHRELSLAPF